MRDFSFHSVFLTSTQIRFLFLWNEQSTINVTISMSIQFLLTYDREEFLMGSFVIGMVLVIFLRPCGVFTEITQSERSELFEKLTF